MATRLVHISDVHFGVENREALAEIERVVAEERPDALVCTGDVTQRATREQYAAAEQWFGRFEIPVWLDPGNHDMPYYNLWERFRRPYGRYERLHAAVAVPHFETEDLVLVPLRTTVRSQRRWPWSDGVVKPGALAETLATLGRLGEDGRLRIVTAHHPLHGPRPDGPSPTIGGHEAFARLAAAGMDAIMTGHVHRPFSERRQIDGHSAQVIGAGTISTRLRDGAPPSYNVLTVERAAAPGDAPHLSVDTRIVAAAA
jgi:3',5'-cyclic AMP phosphodiesterase CpdA